MFLELVIEKKKTLLNNLLKNQLAKNNLPNIYLVKALYFITSNKDSFCNMKAILKIITDHKMLYQLSAYELCNLMLSVSFVELGEVFADELLISKIDPHYLLKNLSLKEKKNLTSNIELIFFLRRQSGTTVIIADQSDIISDYICSIANSRLGLLHFFADIHLLLVIQKETFKLEVQHY